MAFGVNKRSIAPLIPISGLEKKSLETQADMYSLVNKIQEVLVALHGKPKDPRRVPAELPSVIDGVEVIGKACRVTFHETAAAKQYEKSGLHYFKESFGTFGTLPRSETMIHALCTDGPRKGFSLDGPITNKHEMSTRNGIEAIIGYVNTCLVPKTGLTPIDPTDYPALGLDYGKFKDDLTYPDYDQSTLKDALDAKKPAVELPAADRISHAERVRASIIAINEQICGRG